MTPANWPDPNRSHLGAYGAVLSTIQSGPAGRATSPGAAGRVSKASFGQTTPSPSQSPAWAPDGLDILMPTAARMTDYALGGKASCRADWMLVERAQAAWPGFIDVVRANRQFSGRIIEWLLAAGVRQFIDIGSGMVEPRLGATHHLAQYIDEPTWVVYVDVDPIAVSHGRHLLADNPYAHMVHGDLRHPDTFLYDPQVVQRLDFAAPLAVLLFDVMPHIADTDHPDQILTQLTELLAPHSYLAISHPVTLPELCHQQDAVRRLYDHTPTPRHARTRAQVAHLLHGLDLVEPGLVAVTDWHPEPYHPGEPPQPAILAALAHLS